MKVNKFILFSNSLIFSSFDCYSNNKELYYEIIEIIYIIKKKI